MLGARQFAPPNVQPSQEQIEREMDEFGDRILPMFDAQLNGKMYFCGD